MVLWADGGAFGSWAIEKEGWVIESKHCDCSSFLSLVHGDCEVTSFPLPQFPHREVWYSLLQGLNFLGMAIPYLSLDLYLGATPSEQPSWKSP